jgi:hypothetical protein
MDDATINWKIAERLGLKEVQCDDVEEDATILVWIELRDAAGKKYRPDFATSLDAMAEAEASLQHNEMCVYVARLRTGADWEGVTAPARTRALAFLAATENRIALAEEDRRG